MSSNSARQAANSRSAALLAAALTVIAGAVWIANRIAANGPGDSGPVVGPGASAKVSYAAQAGVVVLVVSALVGVTVWLCTRAWQRRCG